MGKDLQQFVVLCFAGVDSTCSLNCIQPSSLRGNIERGKIAHFSVESTVFGIVEMKSDSYDAG